jgi:RAB protein geranylgeranyltransferase component A
MLVATGQQESHFVEFLREKFSLSTRLSEAVAYALALCTSPTGAIMLEESSFT